jgi:two-component system NtrC family sensor kinase
MLAGEVTATSGSTHAGEGAEPGLSMSHDIVVKQYGGSTDVETESGLFTEFRIVSRRTIQR